MPEVHSDNTPDNPLVYSMFIDRPKLSIASIGHILQLRCLAQCRICYVLLGCKLRFNPDVRIAEEELLMYSVIIDKLFMVGIIEEQNTRESHICCQIYQLCVCLITAIFRGNIPN